MKTIAKCALASAVVATLFCSCINKVIKITSTDDFVTRSVKVTSPFTAIATYNESDVIYKNGALDVKVSAPEEYIDRLEIKVIDGTLKITTKDVTEYKEFSNRRSIVTVTAPNVDSFTTSGTGDFTIGEIDVPVATFKSYGTGDFETENVTCGKFELVSAGTGDAEFNIVNCNNALISSSGTGDFKIKKMTSKFADINSSGTGDITIKLGDIEKADINTSGTGDINMVGVKIGQVKKSETGSGEINL